MKDVASRRFLIAAGLIVLAAFALREWFVLTMTVPEPNQGDVGAYLRYALNLAWNGTFSQSPDGGPDAFRSPGYPAMLWALFPGEWESGRWYARIYQAQAVLGALTVAGVIALARCWLSRGWALLAGALMAVQAHHVIATGTILTEVLFGALIVAALLAWAHARDWRMGSLAGLAFGAGALVNPVLSLLPFVLAPLLKSRRAALAMLVATVLCLGAWSARNALVHADGGARAAINFVQGSWPEYHDMAKWEWRWPAKWKALNDEVALIEVDRRAGLERVAARMAKDPARYARWYAGKPFLLFDWEVRIGLGMAYVVKMTDTVMDSGLGLMLTVIQWKLNPLLFALALAGLALGLRQGGAARGVAVSVLYLTAVHVVLQAEPRYSIPYRSLEFLVAVSALAWLRGLVPSDFRLDRRADAPSASVVPNEGFIQERTE